MTRRNLMIRSLVVMLAVTLAACSTPSINPIYSDDKAEVVKDDRVLGLWKPTDDKKTHDRYRVQREEKAKDEADKDKTPVSENETWYKLTLEDAAGNPKKNSQFEMRIVRLGAGDFVDLFPIASEVRDLGDRYGMAAIPTHIIMPVTITDERVVVRPLDLGKVKALLTASPGMTPHTVRDNEVMILTGSSRQVQEFFRRICGDDQVFDDPLVLIRGKDEPPSVEGEPAKTPAKPKPAPRPRRPIKGR